MLSFFKNDKNIKIKTDDGYQNFDGVSFNGIKQTYDVIFDDNTVITATADHELYTPTNKIAVLSLSPKQEVITSTGIKTVKNVVKNTTKKVYDVINTGKNHRFYSNDVLVSNCEFVSSDDTLFDGLVLKSLNGVPPYYFIDPKIKWWKDPQANHIYGVGWDPSLGTGNDFAAIQVIDYTTMEQAAEWQDAYSPCSKQVEVLIKILHWLYREMYEFPEQEGEPEIYWSVENNTVGDSALTAIEYTGIDNFPGVFVSEKPVGRKGFTTTNKSKITTCSQFKRLIETRKLTVYSKNLISEMKTFISKGNSFEAKQGSHDDLISATLMTIRILQKIHNWDESLEEKLSTDINIDDIIIEPIYPIL